ncbi:hypothetical protein M9H77_08322 [Catharanthus roseus]|uniref:Uncharacterized protein n=1 Tax=Catharanthus roseus TaxID=4058 RepID=A0ACC0BXN1_CATRO|nr:hypothetical protein M9H77_08322 [Catharanthus roseus]
MHCLAKGVLNPVLPEDPDVTLTSPPEVAVTKGRKKMDSSERDKSHWEHVSIAHRKIQKSNGSVSSSGTGSRSLPSSGSGSGSRGRGRLPRAPRENGRGRDCAQSNLSAVKHASLYSTFPYTNAFPNVIGDGNCGYRVVADFVFGDDINGQRFERVNELVQRIHWLVDGPAPYAHWLETLDSLYIIANAFNLCVILNAQLGSTTVLPLYSYLDRPEGTLVIGFLTEERYFIQLQLNDMCPIPPLHVQWIHHRSEWVSNWADSYQHRIADWNAKVARNRN